MKMTNLCLCIGSKDFFGAERRYMKILRNILSRGEGDHGIWLVINSSLYRSSRDKPLPKSVMDAFEQDQRLIVLPDRPTHLLETRRPFKFISLFLSLASFHCILRADIIAYARALLPRHTVLELTSPDIALRVARRLPAFLLRRIPRYVSVSETVQARFTSELARRGIELAAERMHIWTIPYFEPGEFHGEAKEKIVVSASRFVKRKNVLLLAKSLKKAIPDLPDWKFCVFGQGEDEAEIRETLGEWIATGQVEVGYSNNTIATLKKSSVYISLIEPDNYPSQSILEAMACANALVLSNTGSSHKFINRELPNGLLVDLSAEAVASALVEVCSDSDRLSNLRRCSRDFVSANYNADRFIDEFMSTNEVAARNSP